MIISKTPYRISFFGGGTDYPEWYRQEGGAVLSTTIDKYCYISCRFLPPFFNIKHRIVWSHIETVSSISEILHPAVREGLRYFGFSDEVGLEIHHQGDLPARSGMGSSSSFAVGLFKALAALNGQVLKKRELALKAIELEQVVLKENVGSQDQVAATYGGLNLIHFHRSGDFNVEPLVVPKERLADLRSKLLLVYTGASRLSSEVAGRVVADLYSKKQNFCAIRRMVDKALAIIAGTKDLDDLGRLLHESWMIKRDLTDGVTTPFVDQVYNKAINSGALGGKLLGAGGAGFMLFYVPPERQDCVLKSLPECLHVPFQFETEGSMLLHSGSHT